jgi:hypothetical protein
MRSWDEVHDCLIWTIGRQSHVDKWVSTFEQTDGMMSLSAGGCDLFLSGYRHFYLTSLTHT